MKENYLSNQRGMALISALLLLLIISLMAVGVSTDTSMDVRIAGFLKFKAQSFANAESGLTAATDILEDNIYEAGWPPPAPGTDFTYPNLSTNYNNGNILNGNIRVSNTRKLDTTANLAQHGKFYLDKNPLEDPVLKMDGYINANIATQRVISKLSKGGATQMAQGYAGKGKGAGSGGVQVVYNIIGGSTNSGGAQSDLAVYYRYVTK